MLRMLRHWLMIGLALLPSLSIIALALTVQDLGVQPLAVVPQLFGDQTRPHSIEEILAAPASAWSPVSQVGQLGASPPIDEYWLRLEIPAAQSDTSESQTWYVQTDFPMFRELDFYLFAQGQLIDSVRSGQKTMQGPNRLLGPHSIYPVERQGPAARQLYIRYTSRLPRILPLRVYAQSSFHQLSYRRNVVIGLLLGLTAGVWLYCLLMLLKLRQRLDFYYLLAITAMFILGLFSTGVITLLAPELGRNYVLVHKLISLMPMFGFLYLNMVRIEFSSRQTIRLSPRNLGSDRQLWLGLASFLILFFMPSVLALLITGALLMGLLAYWIIGIRSRGDGAQNWLFMLQSCALVGGIISILSAFEIIPSNPLNQSIYLLANLIGLYGHSHLNSQRFIAAEGQLQAALVALGKAADELPGSAPAQSVPAGRTVPQLTLMFIDIANFSLISRTLAPKPLFVLLSQRIEQILSIVKEFGGNMDRSLGDGVFCSFGGGAELAQEDHALRAFRAAVKIQEQTVSAALEAKAQGRSITLLPVRIGIHSSEVLVGNLGGLSRIDFTIIGKGVNYASRMETACTPFRIMLSQETQQRLIQAGMSSHQFDATAIALKHVTHLVKAYEFNPFKQREAVYVLVDRMYQIQLGRSPNSQRYTLKPGAYLKLQCEYTSFDIENFSLSGFGVSGDTLLGLKSQVEVELISNDSSISRALEEQMLDHFTVEVVWNRALDGRYQHGLKIYGGSKRQADALYGLLQRVAAAVYGPARDQAS